MAEPELVKIKHPWVPGFGWAMIPKEAFDKGIPGCELYEEPKPKKKGSKGKT